MSKKLNTNDIVNELENSSFFPQRRTQVSPPEASVALPPPVGAPTPAPALTTAQPKPTIVSQKPAKAAAKLAKPAPSTERGYVRRTFDIFEDQLSYLTRTSLEDKLAGGEGSMNSMVREALDAFIEKHKRR